MHIKQPQLKAMLDHRAPLRWAAKDFRRIGVKIVVFIDWRRGR